MIYGVWRLKMLGKSGRINEGGVCGTENGTEIDVGGREGRMEGKWGMNL